MKKVLTIIVIILLISFVVYLILEKIDKLDIEKTSDYPKEAYRCENDSDCVMYEISGCNNSGGHATSVNEDYYEKYLKDQSKSGGFGFPAISSDWTCTAKAKCQKNVCQLVK